MWIYLREEEVYWLARKTIKLVLLKIMEVQIMTQKERIIQYVLNTPCNNNRQILESLLPDYEIATDEDVAILLTNQGYISPVGANDGAIYTDNNDKIYVL